MAEPVDSIRRPRVVADGPLNDTIGGLLQGVVEVLPWMVALEGSSEPIEGIYTYGHPQVDGAMMDRLPGLKVISNFGVGVDHINLADASQRGIPVGNTPGVLEGATADLGFGLLLAAARRVVEGDRYAQSPEFTVYDPGFMLGVEVHGSTLGIIGMGNIGREVAKRARGFEMTVLYHNRTRRPNVETELGVRFASLDELLAEADFVMLTVPLTEETRGMIDAVALAKMKRSAILVNIARGSVVRNADLVEALQTGEIAAAALDVTDPEPLPRDHPLLGFSNVIITPHLGSATVQTRRRMAELSVTNLLAGLRGEPLPRAVT
ncbi:2-hydroxyacid dehydrogenase [Singulisphaera acidiphila]|uniref:Lactate dehydrogenase-like oxidoreductase n=1 Tax=Singulisphaera acidiphila (strain ATCC BAA-1392 / DSM 18658 / VKM B-2454 / MOB10) TaxID=886293 RepID=L0DLE7_SINAD|nr:D-glycerate dehydrogenase [Singulisphaera acidiphila]AGA30067.1 lactate dehydrogenase-like oxidoreductase [Singulisphaera acidiphila DSM 18658]